MTADVPPSERVSLQLWVDELFRALNAHDVDAVGAMHAPDAVLTDPTAARAATGRSEISERFRAIFRAFPDMQYPGEGVRLYVADDQHAAVSWTFTGTMTGRIDPPGYAPTGKTCSVEGVCLYEFVDDPTNGTRLLSRHSVVFDSMRMLQDLGIMPQLESGAAKLTAGLQRTSVLVSHALRRAPARR